MKVSKTQASDNRDAMVGAAAIQIRERGFDQMSVADVARSADLTHGALYSHFESKDELKAEATKRAFDDCLRSFAGLTAPKFIQRYLSPEHRDNPQEGCPTAALVSQVRWQPDASKEAFREGVEGFVSSAAESLEKAGADHDRERAIFMFSALVGGLAISRAIGDVDEKGSNEVLRAVLGQLSTTLLKPSKPRRKRT